MNIQIQQGGKWYFISSVHSTYFLTTMDVNEALSVDYLDILKVKFPEYLFRGV